MGHCGFPVYTTACKEDEDALGTRIAKIVRHMNVQLGVERPAMTVVFLSGNLLKMTSSFYLALRTQYRDEPRSGQKSSLIPLPLFSLDFGDHGLEDLTNAASCWETWTEMLKSYLLSLVGRGQFRKRTCWMEALKCLMADLLSKSVTRDDKFGEIDSRANDRSPASEKVRSILFHLLWKSIFKEDNQEASGAIEEFDKHCRDLRRKAKSVVRAKHPRHQTSVFGPQHIEALLERFSFVSFVHADWIQGLESDVVIACVPVTHTWPCGNQVGLSWSMLSRAKLFSVVVVQGKNEADARSRWLGPWHDWDDVMGKDGLKAEHVGNDTRLVASVHPTVGPANTARRREAPNGSSKRDCCSMYKPFPSLLNSIFLFK